MSDTETPRADTDPMLPEVARYWPALLRGAAVIMNPDEAFTLFDVLPSNMKAKDWQEFAIAAAFLVADMADKLGATIDDLNDMAQQLRARAAAAELPS